MRHMMSFWLRLRRCWDSVRIYIHPQGMFLKYYVSETSLFVYLIKIIMYLIKIIIYFVAKRSQYAIMLLKLWLAKTNIDSWK